MFEVDQEITDQVEEKCHNLKACLSGNMSFCCTVKRVGEDGLVMEPFTSLAFSNCPQSYKDKNEDPGLHVCTCPVRKEIYRKYGE
jgi:hypothetical protein